MKENAIWKKRAERDNDFFARYWRQRRWSRKKIRRAIFQTEQLSTFCVSQIQQWSEVLNTKTHYKRDYKNSKFANNLKNFAIFQDNFVKYELNTKMASNFGDGYILKKIKCIFFLTFFVINYKFSNNFMKCQEFQENLLTWIPN